MNTSVESQKYIDGKLIDNKSLYADYDGNILNLDIKDNEDEKRSTLNNEELLSLFSEPNDNKTIEERLKDSFPILKISKPTRRKNKLNNDKKEKKKAKPTRKNNSSKDKKKKKSR